MLTTATKYTKIKVSESNYEFRFKLFPELGDMGVVVGYEKNVKEARNSINSNPEFLGWFEKCKSRGLVNVNK